MISTKPSGDCRQWVALVKFGTFPSPLVPVSAARVYEQIRSFGSFHHRNATNLVPKSLNIYPIHQYIITIKGQSKWYDIKKQFEINGLECVCVRRQKKNFCVVGDLDPSSIQWKCEMVLVLTTGVVRTEDARDSTLFQRAALLDGLTFLDQYHTPRERGIFPYLMSLEGVLTSESLSARLAEEGFVSGMSIPMSFQVMLTVEGQGTHIASEWAWWRSRILHRTVDWRLWHVLCLGLVISRQLGCLWSAGFRGTMVAVIIQLRVGHDRGHRLPRGV